MQCSSSSWAARGRRPRGTPDPTGLRHGAAPRVRSPGDLTRPVVDAPPAAARDGRSDDDTARNRRRQSANERTHPLRARRRQSRPARTTVRRALRAAVGCADDGLARPALPVLPSPAGAARAAVHRDGHRARGGPWRRERLLGFDPAEHPLTLQLGDSEPDLLAQVAAVLACPTGFFVFLHGRFGVPRAFGIVTSVA